MKRKPSQIVLMIQHRNNTHIFVLLSRFDIHFAQQAHRTIFNNVVFIGHRSVYSPNSFALLFFG